MSVRSWLATDDRWIPGLFVLGFVVMLIANGTMAWVAVASFTGLATTDYYDRGRTYNRTLAAAESQAATGWSVAIETLPAGEGRLTVSARLAARDGRPLHGAEAVVHFVRPSDAGADFEVALAPTGDGLWQAEIAAPAAGLWQARLFVVRGDESFAAETRLVLRP